MLFCFVYTSFFRYSFKKFYKLRRIFFFKRVRFMDENFIILFLNKFNNKTFAGSVMGDNF